MKTQIIKPAIEISLLVKNIMVFEEAVSTQKTVLPFFADGCPGLMFHVSPNGQVVMPQNKLMPTSYIYGQTVYPIELHISGKFKIIVFQLYPYVLRSIFSIDATVLTDTCHDMQQVVEWQEVQSKLLSTKRMDNQIKIISSFLSSAFVAKGYKLDEKIKMAIRLILETKSQITVKTICEKIHLTVRTFERRFLAEVGISAKNFIQINRFQQSLEQLTIKDFKKLTDIVYDNGYADQSHFVRVFKSFTGKTPKGFITKQ